MSYEILPRLLKRKAEIGTKEENIELLRFCEKLQSTLSYSVSCLCFVSRLSTKQGGMLLKAKTLRRREARVSGNIAVLFILAWIIRKRLRLTQRRPSNIGLIFQTFFSQNLTLQEKIKE